LAKKEVWEIVLTRPSEKVYDKAPGDIIGRLDECFVALERNPLHGNNIKALTGKLKGLYRYRVGDWRIIYRLNMTRRVHDTKGCRYLGDTLKG
jgi:mRNA interferase RelE/StbE